MDYPAEVTNKLGEINSPNDYAMAAPPDNSHKLTEEQISVEPMNFNLSSHKRSTHNSPNTTDSMKRHISQRKQAVFCSANRSPFYILHDTHRAFNNMLTVYH